MATPLHSNTIWIHQISVSCTYGNTTTSHSSAIPDFDSNQTFTNKVLINIIIILLHDWSMRSRDLHRHLKIG